MRSQPILGFLYLGESKTPRIGGAAGKLIEQLAKYIIGYGRSQFAFVSVSWLDRGVKDTVLVNNETKIRSWLDQLFREAESSPEAESSQHQNLQMLRLTRNSGSAANIVLTFLSDSASISSKPLLQVQLPDKAQLSDTSIGSEFNSKLGNVLRDLCDDLEEDDEGEDLLPEHLDTVFQHHSGFLELHSYDKLTLSQEIIANNSISGTSAGLEILQSLTAELSEREDDLKVYDLPTTSLNHIWHSQITMLFLQWGVIRFSGSASIYQNIEAELQQDANVQKAITQMEAIITLQSQHHPEKGHKLAQLGGLYNAHFVAHGNTQDLTHTIKRYNEAVALFDPDDPQRAEHLLILGSHLEKRCQLSGNKDDLVEAIYRCQEAVDVLVKNLGPSLPNDLQKAFASHALGAILKRKFENDMDNVGAGADVNDINRAILRLHDAEGLAPHGHQITSIIFSDLCHSHVLKSKYYSYKKDEKQAVSMIETAMDEYNKTLPDPGSNHPAYAMILNAKCQAYSKHYKLVKVKKQASKYTVDIQEAIRVGEMAVEHSDGTSQECTYLLNLGKAYWYLHESSFDTSSTESTGDIPSPLTRAMECFCQSAQCETADHMIRFKSARNWAKVETETAAIAKLKPSESLRALKAYEYCIILLAEIAGEEIPLYEQYRRLEKIQEIVYQATAAAIKSGKLEKAIEFFEEGRSVIWKHYFKHDIIMHALKDKHPDLAEEYSKHQTQLRSNAIDEANSTLKMQAALGEVPKSKAPESSSILDSLKRVWNKIKTVAAEFFSFGLYKKLSLLDKATEHGSIILINLWDKQCDALILQKGKPITHIELPKMTSVIAAKLQKNLKEVIGAVAQSVTPGQNNLPKTLLEVDHLKKHPVAGKYTKVLINKEGTVEKVKEELAKSQWAHFACHGVQDDVDGLKSALILDGGKRLTLKELVERKLPHAEFAFLSACQSAKGDITLPEEHIHLAAGMLTAGYQGVIATMWSIDDDDGLYVAKEVYNSLFKEKNQGFFGGRKEPDFKKAVGALNEAVEKLRKEERVDYMRWVPFVHIGL
ncbi:hypothetical protein H1R20_g2335, partial [Candolleomyces eurysporus]